MKPANRSASAAAGLIVILLTGCDNVSWGGVDVAVVHPPPKATASSSLSPTTCGTVT